MLTVYKIRANYIIFAKGTNAHSDMQTEFVRQMGGVDLVFSTRDEAEEHMATLPTFKEMGNYSREYQYEIEAIEYKYANMHGWSDVYPFEIIRVVSPKTIEVRAMSAELDEEFKPEIIPGGFSGHCVNQNKQTYGYKSCPDGQVLRVRLGKRGWKSTMGKHVLSEQPRKFYDYNF